MDKKEEKLKTTKSLSFWNKKGEQFGEDGKWRWNEVPVSPIDEKRTINSKIWKKICDPKVANGRKQK